MSYADDRGMDQEARIIAAVRSLVLNELHGLGAIDQAGLKSTY